MTVPTGNIRRIKTTERTRLNDDIFEGFIHRMTEMDITIGIGRAIVQDIFVTASTGCSDLLIEIIVLPLF